MVMIIFKVWGTIVITGAWLFLGMMVCGVLNMLWTMK